MLHFSKFSIAILALGLSLSLTADFVEAGRGHRGGSRGGGRSMHRNSRSRSMGHRSHNRQGNNFRNNRAGHNNHNSNRNHGTNRNRNHNNINHNIGSNRHGLQGQHGNNGHGNNGHFGHNNRWNGWNGWYQPVLWGIQSNRATQSYYNPYCSTIDVESSYGYPGQANISFDYSKPILNQNNKMTERGGQLLNEARQAFLAGNYEAASRIIAQAALEIPKNHDVHQLRSLILFAVGDYSNAAGAAHVALTGGPGWNWSTLKSFYNEKEIYTKQLRRLEETRKENSKAPELRFLLGYHYLMMNHVDSAARQLAIAVELEPRDVLAKNLLNAISKKTGKRYGTTPETKEINNVPTPPAPPEIPGTTEKPVRGYAGIYKASPANGVNIKLELKAGGKFNWSIENPKTKKEFSGTFQIKNNVITLIRDNDGEKMIAILSPQGKGFNFKLQNGNANDPGLNFQP